MADRRHLHFRVTPPRIGGGFSTLARLAPLSPVTRGHVPGDRTKPDARAAAPIVMTAADLDAGFLQGIERTATLIEVRLALAEYRTRHGHCARLFVAGGEAGHA